MIELDANDGPLTKWLLAHGKKHVPDRVEQNQYNRDLKQFRRARKARCGHGMLLIQMIIDELHAVLEFHEDNSSYYKISLTIGDAYLRETVAVKNNRFLAVGTKTTAPLALVESLVGREAQNAIALPETLQPVVAGRIIQSFNQFNEWLTFGLDTEPW